MEGLCLCRLWGFSPLARGPQSTLVGELWFEYIFDCLIGHTSTIMDMFLGLKHLSSRSGKCWNIGINQDSFSWKYQTHWSNCHKPSRVGLA